MGGFIIQSKNDSFECYRPRPLKLMSLFEKGAIPWPDSSDDEIKGRSKADWLTKGIAMIQILYFVTSLIGRWAQGLAVTTLELFTLAIVVCAMIMFVAWWHKPFDVQIPIVISSETRISEDCIIRVGLGDADGDRETWWFWVAIIITCVAFGALHIAAWNFYFPSPIEKLLWRISSILCTGLVFCLIFLVLQPIAKRRWLDIPFSAMSCLYILVRTYMFVEMFASLRAVPESVYQTPQWSQYFPFLG